jgi:hypothetical protein
MASKIKTNSQTGFVHLRVFMCVLNHPPNIRRLRLSNGDLEDFCVLVFEVVGSGY